MATEIFLKAVLIQESNASESELKRFGHRIGDIAMHCHTITGNKVFDTIVRNALVFPDVSARYDSFEWPFAQVWGAVLVAQTAGSALARQYSDRDLSSYVLASSSALATGGR
ncbi:hypothetical protein PATSB16_24670 [Pandoraea thiooxydans]|nr:hypothetical protein PATSB16_24670 [Pandoraea thiooxydans]